MKEEKTGPVPPPGKASPPPGGIVIDRFRPEDAEGISRCYFAVYGPDFPLDYVYDPERIRASFADRDHAVVVARTGEGEVVGLAGLFRNAPGAGVFETGQCVILKAHRGRPARVARRLAEIIMEEVAFERGIDALFAESVTHTGATQKIGLDFGLFDCALEMGLMPEASYGREAAGSGRVSLIIQFRIYRDRPHEVYLPDLYRETLLELYRDLGVERTYPEPAGASGAGEGGATTPEESRASSEHYAGAGVSRLSLGEAGRDFAEVLARFEAEAGEAVVLEVYVNLGSPTAPEAAAALRKAGYFFGGLLPLWFDRDGLLMQKSRRPPDFDAPILVSERAKWLLGVVRADYTDIQTG